MTFAAWLRAHAGCASRAWMPLSDKHGRPITGAPWGMTCACGASWRMLA